MQRILFFSLLALALMAMIFALQSDTKIIVNMSTLIKAFKDMGSAVSVETPPAQASTEESKTAKRAAATQFRTPAQPRPAPATVYKCTAPNGHTIYASDSNAGQNCTLVSEKLSVVPSFRAPRNTAAPSSNSPRKSAQPQGIQSSKKTLNAQEERKTQRCDDLLERMANIDQQARQRSTQALRDRKKRLQEEHSRLGCSWFHSSRR